MSCAGGCGLLVLDVPLGQGKVALPPETREALLTEHGAQAVPGQPGLFCSLCAKRLKCDSDAETLGKRKRQDEAEGATGEEGAPERLAAALAAAPDDDLCIGRLAEYWSQLQDQRAEPLFERAIAGAVPALIDDADGGHCC